MQAPATIVALEGPELRITLANPPYQQLVGDRPLLGRPLREAVPEIVQQPHLLAAAAQVYQTGQPLQVQEVETQSDRTNTGRLETTYFNTSHYPTHDAQGRVSGTLSFSYDVTEQVLARRQLEQFNQELEARVQARTQELAKAQAEVEIQRLRLHQLVAEAPAMIASLRGPHYIVELANEGFRAVFGGRDLLGLPYREAIPEFADQPFFDLLDTVYRTGETYYALDQPVRVDRHHSGQLEELFSTFIYQATRDAQGQIDGLLLFGYEVTEQVRARQRVEQLNQELEARVAERTHALGEAQAATERERALLHALLTQAPVAIALFQGEELRITTANELMTAVWGYVPAQVVGLPFMEGVPELQGQGFDELLRQVLRTQVSVTGTETPATMRRDGALQTTYYNFVYQPLYNAAGEVLGVIDVAVEVTEQVEARRQVEQLNAELETRVQERTRQLSEQQQLLRQILGQVPAAIATLSGPDHRYTFFNEGYQQLAANRPALGLTVAEASPELVAQGFIGLLDQVYTTGEPFVGTDVPAQLYDATLGELRPYYVDFIYQPLFDDQQRVRGILAFIVDVTDRAKARQQAAQSQQQVHDLNQELAAINEELTSTNEELGESNMRLTRTNHDLDTFVYTASHDLKAPITNIEGILYALRDTLPEAVQRAEAVRHLLGLLDHTVGRFRTTIHQLTDLSRLQQTYNEPAQLLALGPVVADVLADLAPQIAAAAAQVQVEVPADLRVSFAPSSLRSVVYNLLSNAVKYRAPERPAYLWLRAEQRPGQVVLSVQDNGLGLSASQQGRLFGVFQRLHTHVEGTGVGLYMIKRLIENAGSTIAVTSAPGVGSTFTVTFPA